MESNWSLVALKARSSIHRDRIWDAAALALLALQGTHITLKLGQTGFNELQKSNRPGQLGWVVGHTKDTSGTNSRSGNRRGRRYWRRKVNTLDIEGLTARAFRPRAIALRPRGQLTLFRRSIR